MMRALAVGLTLWLSGWMVNAQSAPIGGRVATATHYDLELRPQLEGRTVDGSLALTVQGPDAGASRVTLNRGALEIDQVLEGDRPLTFRIDRTQLQIDVPPSSGGHERTIAFKVSRPANVRVGVPSRARTALHDIHNAAVDAGCRRTECARHLPSSTARTAGVDRSGLWT